MMTQPPDLDATSTLAREAKARADRAAPGPWEGSFATLYNQVTMCNGRTICTDGGRQAGRPDIAFIAAARTDVPALADAVLALVERVRELEREDSEAARYVELPITMRTGFTGDEPYVGWKGLGLALTEALDERDRLRGNAE